MCRLTFSNGARVSAAASAVVVALNPLALVGIHVAGPDRCVFLSGSASDESDVADGARKSSMVQRLKVGLVYSGDSFGVFMSGFEVGSGY